MGVSTFIRGVCRVILGFRGVCTPPHPSPVPIYDYTSVLSGPLLACLCGSFLCLIPIHYLIEYPKYWYEEQTVRFLTCIVIWLCQYASEVINWSNFPMKGKWKTCLFLVILGGILYASVMVAYHFIWTEYLGFFQPMPFNGHLQGFIASTMMNTALWFR